MFDRVIYGADAAAAIGKGAIMAATVTLLDVEFWKALIITAVSAMLTGAWGLFVAWLAIRETRRTRERVDDVAGKVDADRRHGEPGGGE